MREILNDEIQAERNPPDCLRNSKGKLLFGRDPDCNQFMRYYSRKSVKKIIIQSYAEIYALQYGGSIIVDCILSTLKKDKRWRAVRLFKYSSSQLNRTE